MKGQVLTVGGLFHEGPEHAKLGSQDCGAQATCCRGDLASPGHEEVWNMDRSDDNMC